MIVRILKNNKWLLIIFVVFILTRFLGLDQIYHQDEYRWAMQADPQTNEVSPHPPLTKYFLKVTGLLFGFDNLRIGILFFSILNLWLIYLILFRLTGKKKIALIGSGLFTVNVYGLIANLQIDIDGAVLPFFILLSYCGYLIITEDIKSKKGIVVFCLAIVGGFLTKLSFLLFVGALIADQLLRVYYIKEEINLKSIIKKLWPWIVGFLAIAVVFYYFYATRLKVIIDYAEHFKSLNFASRAYFDLVFKIFKSFVWLSPLLALSVLYGFFKRDIFNKYRIWFIYLFLNFIFYLVLFDFSTLTVERYFMFLIIPSVLVSAQVIYDFLERKSISINKKVYIVIGIIFVLLSFVILSLPHDILPLNPKTAYVDKVKSFDYGFLIPFTGGSGPSGFYFSAWFILLSWLVAPISIVGIALAKNKKIFLAIFLIFGLGYNILFDSEYLFGTLYGSVDKVAKKTIEYVNSNDAINGVITYYDIGSYYLRLSGKYDSRFYTAPKRDYTPKITDYRGQYMIVDFPAIDKEGRYWPLIIRCPLLKKFQNKKIESYVFDCSKI